MKTDDTLNDSFLTDDGEPNVRAMLGALDDAMTGAGALLEKMQRDINTRYARWADQTDTGRKPQTVGGREAEPYPGASDVRIRLADEFINDDVKLCKSVSKRGKLRVKGRESGDYANAGKVGLYLGYLRDTQLRKEWRKEATLAAQWRQTFGYAFTRIDWVQEWAIEHRPLTMDMLTAAVTQAPGTPVAAAAQMLFDPDKQKELASMLTQLIPDLDRGAAYERINELKSTGKTTLPARYLRLNRPRRKALKPYRDVIHPVNMSDVQEASWIAVRCFFTPQQVREKELSANWSEDFIEALERTVGKNSFDAALRTMDEQRREVFQDSVEETKGLIEVFYFYYLQSNDSGIPERRCAVISPHIASAIGRTDEAPSGPDELVGYDHGLFPFVEHRREDNDDALCENRGIPEIVMTHQREMKDQRDGRINQMDMALQPPVIRPEREIGLRLMFRPRGEIGERKQQTYRFGEVPPYQPGAVELENSTRLDAERYFGKNEAQNPSRAQAYAQDLADAWADEEAESWSMVLQLSQQFLDEAAFERVVGQTRTPITLSRADIQGAYDVTIKFDTTPMMDPDAIENRLGQLNQLVGMDRGGVINLAQAVRGIFELLFPDLADDALDDIETASQREVDDEQGNWVKLLAGVPVPMVDKGQNFQIRLMALEQILAQPLNQQRAAAAPDVQKAVQDRLEHLKFMVQQFGANAQAGRVGVMPSPGSGQAA